MFILLLQMGVLLWVRVCWAAQTGAVSGLRSLLLSVPESSKTSRVSKRSLQRLWVWACRGSHHCEKLQGSSITRKILLKCQDYTSLRLMNPIRCRGCRSSWAKPDTLKPIQNCCLYCIFLQLWWVCFQVTTATGEGHIVPKEIASVRRPCLQGSEFFNL